MLLIKNLQKLMDQFSREYLEDELNHFSVDQTMDRLAIDVSDEVTSTEASFLGGPTVLHMLPIHKKMLKMSFITQQNKLHLQ